MTISQSYMQQRWDHFSNYGLFVKQMRKDMPKESIIEQFAKSFEGRVRSKALANNFFLLDCIDQNIKKKILFGEPLFYEGFYFYKFDQEPNFNPINHKPKKLPQWIKLENLPSEYWSEEILERIGETLGTFIGFEEEFFVGKSDTPKILVDLELDHKFLDISGDPDC